jgi:hypothetical protein
VYGARNRSSRIFVVPTRRLFRSLSAQANRRPAPLPREQAIRRTIRQDQ